MRAAANSGTSVPTGVAAGEGAGVDSKEGAGGGVKSLSIGDIVKVFELTLVAPSTA